MRWTLRQEMKRKILHGFLVYLNEIEDCLNCPFKIFFGNEEVVHQWRHELFDSFFDFFKNLLNFLTLSNFFGQKLYKNLFLNTYFKNKYDVTCVHTPFKIQHFCFIFDTFLNLAIDSCSIMIDRCTFKTKVFSNLIVSCVLACEEFLYLRQVYKCH